MEDRWIWPPPPVPQASPDTQFLFVLTGTKHTHEVNETHGHGLFGQLFCYAIESLYTRSSDDVSLISLYVNVYRYYQRVFVVV